MQFVGPRGTFRVVVVGRAPRGEGGRGRQGEGVKGKGRERGEGGVAA